MAGASAAPYWVNAAAGQAPRSHLPMQGGSGVGGGGAGTPEASPPGARPPPPEVSRELNRLITQASTLHDLMRTVNASFDSLNGVNLCTAYHRIARHTQDSRSSLDRLPPPLLTQLGGLLTRLNIALVPMVTQVQAQNLGITLWSMSKLARAPQSHASDLIDALQQEVARRLQNVTKHMYLKDKHYNFGAQALSNVIYSAAYMNRRLDYELLHLVAKAMGWQIEDFRPQGLANTVWSLGKLGTKLTFEVRKLVDACCAEMCTQLRHQGLKGNFAPQNISNALHGLAKLGYVPPPDLLAAMATCALGQLRLFGAQEMTNMVWGYAQLASNGAELPQEAQALFDRVADDLTLLLQDRQWRTRVRPQTISNLAWAFAKLKRCPQKLNQDLVREALSLLPQFKPQELSNLLWALATMGHYPGSGIIDALVQAICTVCVEMKPQELANTAWALATLRHFPGAKALDPLIHHAASMLDRFKAQEIGNLLWALARLGYMPAAGFALAVMPFIQQWRQTDVQDCGNLLWAFMILDVLTPEAVQLLGERLRALPISQFTQESYIQIYQAKMAMSQKVATIAQHIPPELLRQAELEWRQQSFHNRVSKTHKEVSDTLMQLSEPHEVERRIEDGLLSVDLALNDRMVAVEVDGSSHFSVNEPYVPLGKSVLRWRILASRGWRVVTVPYYRWAVLRTADERKEYLWRLLQCNSVWECLSVDPSDRDAPMVFPPNMAHITRDDVVSYLAPGAVLPSLPTFLHPRPGPSQAASPVSTLMGALTRPGSTHSTPSAPNQLTPLQRVPSSSGGGVREGGASGGRSAHGDASLLPLSAPLTAAGSWGGQEGAEPASPQLPYGFGSPFNNNGGADGGGRPRPPSLPQFPHLAAAADGGGHVQGSAAQPPPPSSSSMGAYGGLHGLPAPLCGGSGAGGAGAGPQQRQPSSAHARGLSVAAKPFSMSCPSSAGPPYGGTGLGGAGSAAPPPSNTSLYFTPPQATPLSAAYSSPPLSLPPGCPPAPAGDSSWGPASLSLPQSLSPDQPPLLSAAAPAAALQGSEFCTPTHSPSTLPLLPIAPPSLPQLGQRHAHGSGTAESMPESMSVPRVSTHPATDLLSSAPQDDEIDDLRSYFAQVTGVSAAPPASSSAVLSLEQAMVRVLALPSDCPIADLAPCFQHWEGERFAQLLTALGGQQARSLQLFDWVRGLPPDAPLSALCCAASYAAMIGLHGEWRQPGRALRLLSDAKARGVELGAEIYAALVQAMCRCGQYDVASDAFQHMLTQQLPIEGAVLRSVLSSYMERGAWGEVLRLLDLMQAHDADVDAQTYTLVISGAAGAGDRGLLMSAYNHMCDAGVAPTPDTFVKLVDLTLQWERSVVVAAEGLLSLAAMAPVGADSPTGSQDSPESRNPTEAGPLLCLLRACHATGQWHLAQQVLARAGQHGFPTCLRAANEVIATAAQCGMPEQAQAMFDGLAADGLTPDAASYRGLVEAYLRGGDWMQGCMKYEEAVAAGHTLPSSACCAVLGALWDSGLAWAQAKAGLLHGELLSAGALDPPLVTSCRGSLRVDLNVVDPGAGVLALRQWMLQLRDSIGNSQTAGLLEKHRKLVIMNGSSGSTPQGLVSDELKGMVGTTLVVHRSPFKLSLESGRASRLEASAQLVTKWLFTESFQGWCRVVGGEGGLAGSPLTLHSLPPISAWREVEEGRRQECFKAFQAIRAREARQEEDLQRCPDAYRSRRVGLISQSRTLVHSVLKLPLEVWHTAAALLDGVGRSGYLPPNDALLAAACVVAAAKQEGQSADLAALAAALDSEAVLQSTGLTPTAALDAEVSHLAALLGGATAPTSARRCWRLYADRLGVDPDNTQQVHSLLGDSSATLDSLLGNDFSLQHPPSLQAAAVVSAARKQAGIPPFWPSVLRELTGYDDRTHQQFADAVACFERPTSYGPMVVAQVFS